MDAKIVERDGKKFLVVEIEMGEPYNSAKMRMVATSGGFQPTTLKVDGKIIKVNLSAGSSLKG